MTVVVQACFWSVVEGEAAEDGCETAGEECDEGEYAGDEGTPSVVVAGEYGGGEGEYAGDEGEYALCGPGVYIGDVCEYTLPSVHGVCVVPPLQCVYGMDRMCVLDDWSGEKTPRPGEKPGEHP